MTTTKSTDPSDFLRDMRGVSFSKVGACMLIRAHMLLSPDHCMTRAGIHAALRTRTPFAIDLVTEVIDELFEVDEDGTIYTAERGSNRIRAILPTNQIITIAV